MNRIIVAIIATAACLLLSPGAYAAELTLHQIASEVGRDAAVHAEFDQTRTLTALTRPILASGKVVVAGRQGIIWQIDRPYRVKYVIADGAVVEIGPDGARKKDAAEKGHAGNRATKLIGSLLDLNEKILSENFAITVSGDINRWTILLAPQGMVARFLTRITMEGSGAFLETVYILEAQGDSTHLKFHNSRRDEPLSVEEKKLIQGS